jgi:hypothetical protein
MGGAGSNGARLLFFLEHRQVRVLRSTLLVLALTLPTASCIRTVHLETVEVAQDIRLQSPPRSATNLPPSFDVVVPPRAPGDCPPRLRDPSAGAVLDLYRAMTLPVQGGDGTHYESVGDYRITPAGHYGSTGELNGLRLHCGRLTPIGLIALSPR